MGAIIPRDGRTDVTLVVPYDPKSKTEGAPKIVPLSEVGGYEGSVDDVPGMDVEGSEAPSTPR